MANGLAGQVVRTLVVFGIFGKLRSVWLLRFGDSGVFVFFRYIAGGFKSLGLRAFYLGFRLLGFEVFWGYM